MRELIDEITYKGRTTKELLECVDMSRATVYRQLEKLVDEGLVINENGSYRKLRPLPSVGEMLDKMMTYHQQNLMDWRYKRKPKSIQADLTLQWIIGTPNVIKGEPEEYDEEKLQDVVVSAYNIFQRQIGA